MRNKSSSRPAMPLKCRPATSETHREALSSLKRKWLQPPVVLAAVTLVISIGGNAFQLLLSERDKASAQKEKIAAAEERDSAKNDESAAKEEAERDRKAFMREYATVVKDLAAVESSISSRSHDASRLLEKNVPDHRRNGRPVSAEQAKAAANRLINEADMLKEKRESLYRRRSELELRVFGTFPNAILAHR